MVDLLVWIHSVVTTDSFSNRFCTWGWRSSDETWKTFVVTFLGTNISCYQGPFEDDYLFPKEGYVIIPWRVSILLKGLVVALHVGDKFLDAFIIFLQLTFFHDMARDNGAVTIFLGFVVVTVMVDSKYYGIHHHLFATKTWRIQVFWDCNSRDVWTRKTGRSSNGGGGVQFFWTITLWMIEPQHVF